MFVDDMGCGCNKVKAKEAQRKSIMQQAQHNSQKHSDYVEVTGGLIAADKSHCYSVKWKHENGQKVPDLEGGERDIELTQGDGVTRKIKLMKSDVEHKTLGCWVNPIGVNEKAKQQIRTMIKTWTNRMEHSYLKPKLVRKSYETELKMQIQYRMPIYKFSKADCDEMMKLINPTILHAHYANKNYARSLLEANDQYAGMKITHLYDVMGTEKLKFLFMHLRRWDDTGKLLTISMQKTQLECGTSELFFQLDYEKWAKLVTPTWSTHLWEYCDSRAVRLEIKKKIIYEKPRENDKFIMDVLTQSKLLSEEELVKINSVRQHLQLLTLADMVDLRGRKIMQGIKQAKKVRRSALDFATQDPPDTWLELWKTQACMTLHKYVSKYPLGEWVAPTHQRWEWQRPIGNTNVIYCGSEKYIRKGYVYKKSDQCFEMEEEFQDGVEMIDVNFDRRGNPYIVAFEEKEVIYVKPKIKEAKNGSDVVAGEIIHWVHNMDKLLQAIENDEWCLATDGSNYMEEGAYAWGIAGTDGTYIVKGKGRVACAHEDSSSLRPEMIAIIQALRFVENVRQTNVIIRSNKEDIRKVQIHTDSEVTIKDMQHSYFPTTKNVFENNIDVKIELKTLLRTSKVKYELIHVRSHQDEKKEEWELKKPERLNCEIDKFAATVYEDSECGKHSNIAPCLSSQICSLVLPYHRPTTNILEQIVEYANGHRAEKQLSTYWKVPLQWMCNIEWKSLRKAIRRERETNKHHLSKLIHKQLPTFAMLKRNRLSLTDACPICGKASETWDHVLKCQHVEMKQVKIEQMDNVKKILEKKKTHPVLQQRIVAAMLQYLNNYPITIPEGDGLYKDINKSFRDQMTLGIGNMFCGVITHKFGDIQQNYYNEIDANKRMYTKSEWNVAVIRVLLNFSRNIWKHRCEYVHNVSTISLQNQERETA